MKLFNNKSDFSSEKEMCNYIEKNIEYFCRDILGDEYVSHKREFSFIVSRGKRRKGDSNSRIDFYVKCRKKEYGVEVKNPGNIMSELTRSISQLMMYQLLFENIGAAPEIVLITSRHHEIMQRMFKRFKLPYRYIIFDKEKSAEMEIV